MKIDLSANKTDAQWFEFFDKLYLSAVPKWFEWLEWVLIMGAITYLAEQTGSTILAVVSGFSYAALLFYLQSFFFSIEFSGIPFVKSDRIRRIISITISGILASAVYYLLTRLIEQLRGNV